MIYLVIFNINFDINIELYSLKKAQIAYLKLNKTFIRIFIKYTNFVDIFLFKLATKLPKYMSINNYNIQLVDN